MIQKVFTRLKIFSLPIQKLFRIRDWWDYKISHTFFWVYLICYFSDIQNPLTAVWLVVGLIIYFFFMASFGFLLNDFSDMEIDRLAQKENTISKMEPKKRIIVFLGLLAGIILSPLVLNTSIQGSTVLFSLIIFQILCFCLYSLPPFRLKHSLFGVLLDAHYANIIPVFYVVFTGIYFWNAPHFQLELLILIYFWQLTLGIKDVLTHQFVDYDNDEKSDSKTLIRNLPKAFAKKLVCVYLPVLEMILFLCLLLAICMKFEWSLAALLAFYISYVGWRFYNLHVKEKLKSRDIAKPYYYNNFYLNEFYNRWLSLTMLIILAVEKPILVLALIPMHLVLFGLPKKKPNKTIVQFLSQK